MRAVLGAASRKRFSAGSSVISEGDAAEHLFLMLDGGARYFTMSPEGKKVAILWIRPGELIGGAAFMSTSREYVLSAEAVKSSSTLVWDRATIRALAAEFPRLLENALLLAQDYLVHFRIRYVAANCHSAPQRLAQVLGYLAKEMGAAARSWRGGACDEERGVGARGECDDIHGEPPDGRVGEERTSDEGTWEGGVAAAGRS